MDSDKGSARVERLEVVETGRRRRWSESEKLKIVLESLQKPRQVAATARRYGISRSLLLRWRQLFRRGRTANGLRFSDGGPGAAGGAWFGRAGRDDRDRVCRRPDADRRRGRCRDAEGSGRNADRRTSAMIPIASGVRVWIATATPICAAA